MMDKFDIGKAQGFAAGQPSLARQVGKMRLDLMTSGSRSQRASHCATSRRLFFWPPFAVRICIALPGRLRPGLIPSPAGRAWAALPSRPEWPRAERGRGACPGRQARERPGPCGSPVFETGAVASCRLASPKAPCPGLEPGTLRLTGGRAAHCASRE